MDATLQVHALERGVPHRVVVPTPSPPAWMSVLSAGMLRTEKFRKQRRGRGRIYRRAVYPRPNRWLSTALICAAVLLGAHTSRAAELVGARNCTDGCLNTVLASAEVPALDRGPAPLTIDSQEAPIVVKGAASPGTSATEATGRGLLQSIWQLLATYRPLIVAACLVLLYGAVIVFVRAFWVVRPNDFNLRGEVARIRATLGLEQEHPAHQTETEKVIMREVRRILQEAKELFEAKTGPQSMLRSMLRELSLRAGRQNAAWRRIHDAQCLAVDIYVQDVVETRAVFACAELAALKSKGAGAVADALHKELRKNDKDLGRLKALLKEAEQILYERRDGNFEQLYDWNNKGLWLVAAAAVLVVCLTPFGNGHLLLLGAVGGLLSKLRGIVKRRSVPYDYGVSWTTLFLTPLVGALTGWVGVLLLPIFVEFDLLGDFFDISWSQAATTHAAWALAIFFGLGATYFDQLLESAQKQDESKQPSGASEGA